VVVLPNPVNEKLPVDKSKATVLVCPLTLPPKTINKATTPEVRRINFFNKFSVGLVAADALNFTFDALSTRDKKEYNDFMPVAV
jgi:hypothetical protein